MYKRCLLYMRSREPQCIMRQTQMNRYSLEKVRLYVQGSPVPWTPRTEVVRGYNVISTAEGPSSRCVLWWKRNPWFGRSTPYVVLHCETADQILDLLLSGTSVVRRGRWQSPSGAVWG